MGGILSDICALGSVVGVALLWWLQGPHELKHISHASVLAARRGAFFCLSRRHCILTRVHLALARLIAAFKKPSGQRPPTTGSRGRPSRALGTSGPPLNLGVERKMEITTSTNIPSDKPKSVHGAAVCLWISAGVAVIGTGA